MDDGQAQSEADKHRAGQKNAVLQAFLRSRLAGREMTISPAVIDAGDGQRMKSHVNGDDDKSILHNNIIRLCTLDVNVLDVYKTPKS